MKTRIFLLSCSLAAALSMRAQTVPLFADVYPSDSYYNTTVYMFSVGVTSGCVAQPLNYCAGVVITRAQLATLVVRANNVASGYSPDDFSVASPVPYYNDVPPSHPNFAYIQKLREMNMANFSPGGYDPGCPGAGNFCPDAQAHNWELAVMLAGPNWCCQRGNFPNDPMWGTSYILAFEKAYAMVGSAILPPYCPSGSFCSDWLITRAQASFSIVYGLLGRAAGGSWSDWYNQLHPPAVTGCAGAPLVQDVLVPFDSSEVYPFGQSVSRGLGAIDFTAGLNATLYAGATSIWNQSLSGLGGVSTQATNQPINGAGTYYLWDVHSFSVPRCWTFQSTASYWLSYTTQGTPLNIWISDPIFGSSGFDPNDIKVVDPNGNYTSNVTVSTILGTTGNGHGSQLNVQWNVAPNAAVGEYKLYILASTGSRYPIMSLYVQAAPPTTVDFTLSVAQNPGQSTSRPPLGSINTVNFTVTAKTTPTNNLTGTITLAPYVSANYDGMMLPPGVGPTAIDSVTLSGPNATGTRTFSIQLPGGSYYRDASDYTVYVTGLVNGRDASSASTTLSVAPGSNFTVTVSSSLPSTVDAGSTATYAVGINSLNSFSGPVTMSCAAPPAGTTCSFSPASVTLPSQTQSTMTITTTTATPPGPATFNVNGTASGALHGATATLNIRRPSPAVTINAVAGSPVYNPTIIVDGVQYPPPQSFHWAAGETHTISTLTPQAGRSAGVQLVFMGWSDSTTGTISQDVTRTITVPSSMSANYVALFMVQNYLTASTNSSSGGNISPSSGWYDRNAPISVSAQCPNTQVTVQIPTEKVCVKLFHGICATPPIDLPTELVLNVKANGVTGPDQHFSVFGGAEHLLNSCDSIFGVPGLSDICHPLITHTDGTLISSDKPAKVGEVITLYAVGLGLPAPKTGYPNPPEPAMTSSLSLVISHAVSNGTGPLDQGILLPMDHPINPTYAGWAPGYIGLYQINFTVPPLPDGVLPCPTPSVLTNTVISVYSPNPMAICVQP